jgi:SAM-dependent methyltransferase
MADGQLIFELLPQARSILDVGCGPTGSHWWPRVPEGAIVTAIDLHFEPRPLPPFVRFRKLDAHRLAREAAPGGPLGLGRGPWHEAFDLVVADHLLEHVEHPERVAEGMFLAARPGGVAHVGVPDASYFTDRFYRLIHPDGGGHVAQHDRDSLAALMERQGFRTEMVEPWADDWVWLSDCYDPGMYHVRHITREEIRAIAEVFRRELTREKGYLYGWEFVFRKPERA